MSDTSLIWPTTYAMKGPDENDAPHFHHAFTTQLVNLLRIPTRLLEHDPNIVHHRQRLSERRITHGEAPKFAQK